MSVEPKPPARSVREQAVSTGLAYLLAASVRGRDRKRRQADAALMFRLGGSLSYRAESVHWHPSLLRVLHSAALRRLAEASRDDEHVTLFQIAAEHHYLFDDLMFNAISLFDYVGNVAGFALYGEQRRNAKWDRIQKYARDPVYETRDHPRPRISSTPLGECILDVQATFVRPLTEYRAAPIHCEALQGPREFATIHKKQPDGTFEPEWALTLQVSVRFSKALSVPGYEADPTKALLLDAADWVAAESSKQAIRVFRSLEMEVREEAGVFREGSDGRVEIV